MAQSWPWDSQIAVKKKKKKRPQYPPMSPKRGSLSKDGALNSIVLISYKSPIFIIKMIFKCFKR